MTRPFDNRDWDARQIQDKDAEIVRLGNEILELGHRVKLSEYQKLQALCARAADALGDYHGLYQQGLIDELRKASG
jgi:hypothetical protein